MVFTAHDLFFAIVGSLGLGAGMSLVIAWCDREREGPAPDATEVDRMVRRGIQWTDRWEAQQRAADALKRGRLSYTTLRWREGRLSDA